jgi:O-antigen/teichoic acid export membrane protein
MPPAGDSGEPTLVRNLARSVTNLVGRFGAITFLSGLSTIAITRLLGPASYGQYAAAVATWSVLGATADFGFSLMLSRDLPHVEGSHRSVLRSAYEVATAWSSVLAVVMVGLAFSAGVTSERGLALLILAPSMVFNGLNPARVFFVVKNRTGTLLRVDVITTALQVIATVIVAAAGLGIDAIAVALSVGSIVNGVAIALAANRLLGPSTERQVGRRELIRRSVPLGLLAVMTKVYLMIDLVLLGWLVSGSRLGDYAAASKLLTILATISGVVVAGALPAISSLVAHRAELERLTQRIWTWLVVGAMPIFVAVALFAPLIIRVLLGSRYLGAASLMRILCLAGVISVLNSLLGNLMIAFHKMRPLFLQNAGAITLNVIGNLILVPSYGVVASAWLTAGTEVLVCLAALVVIAKELDLRPSLTASVRPAVAVIVSAAIALLLHRWTIPAVAASSVSFLALMSALGAWPADFRSTAVLAGVPASLSSPRIMSTTSREIPRQDETLESEMSSPATSEIGARDWRWWTLGTLALVLVAVLVAAVVYVVSNRTSPTYQSSAVVRVSVQATTGISDPAVTAANDLASQFAQLASTEPVVNDAASRLGTGTNLGSITAGTIAAQNLIRISVTGSSASQAKARTTAVAKAFVAYVNRINARQASDYARAVTSKLGPLDREIAAARKRLLSASLEAKREATVLLSSLIGQEQTVLTTVAQSSAAAQPHVQLVAPGGAAKKTSPKPLLYAGIGLLATVLLLGRLLYMLGVRRVNIRETPI